jgi:lipopolysaccharide heptosyltransferase I
MGDVVRTRFAFAGLRALYPEAEIDWLVDDRAAAALDGIVGLDRVVRLPRRALRASHPLRTLRVLRGFRTVLEARHYDLCVDFHGILKSGLLAWISRAPVRIGYGRPAAREGAQLFLTHRVRPPAHVSRFERNAALVRALGGRVPDERPPLALPAEIEQELADRARGVVALHPGTSASTLYKRWDPERYAELAARLRKAEGYASLVTWAGASERATAEEVVAASEGAASLAPPTPSVAHLLALLRQARAFVGNDSGPMHIATLAGIPVVALFGPTDPVENCPFSGVPTRMLRHDVGCNPCREGCPARTCMSAIEVDEVVRAVRELIAAPTRVD